MATTNTTLYFGVIGNRDYIKWRGDRLPFWSFLDEHPDGWLCSLAYIRTDVPTDRRRLWDCGAWSYKDKDIPTIKGDKVTALWAFEQYQRLACENDLVVAPDHMLIPGKDLEERRRFNSKSAEAFIAITAESGFIPMAGVHGATLEERLDHARELRQMGYEHLALGGLAGRASQKRMVTEIVATIRREIPNVWLHVLGLSAPYYYAEWLRLGIDSCDGASQFKQAFSGTFYTEQNGKLTEHRAVKPDEAPIAPLCNCQACSMLREDSIDTRTYGSNQHNMGRAAHNLNMLMRAHDHVRRNASSTSSPVQHRLNLIMTGQSLEAVGTEHEQSRSS